MWTNEEVYQIKIGNLNYGSILTGKSGKMSWMLSDKTFSEVSAICLTLTHNGLKIFSYMNRNLLTI